MKVGGFDAHLEPLILGAPTEKPIKPADLYEQMNPKRKMIIKEFL